MTRAVIGVPGRRARSPCRTTKLGTRVGLLNADSAEIIDSVIVVVLPDSGERYLSSVLFEGVFDASGLAPDATAA